MLKINAAESVSAEKLVDYQDSTIVSREIIQKETGTVSVFAFDSGEALSEHTAPFDAIVNILDGNAEVIIEGKSYEVKSGEMIVMPANIPHALKANVRFKMMLTMIK